MGLLILNGGNLRGMCGSGSGSRLKVANTTRGPVELVDDESVIGLDIGRSTITSDGSLAAATMTGTIQFEEVGASGDTITRSSGSFISDGFKPGQEIWIDIPSNPSSVNNIKGGQSRFGSGQILSVTDTVLTLTSQCDLVNEGPTASVTVKGIPWYLASANLQNTSTAPLVMAFKDFTLDGGQTVESYTPDPSNADVANGLICDARAGMVRDVLVQNWRGTGIKIQRSRLGAAEIGLSISGSIVRKCHTGIEIPSGDIQISNCQIYECRDAGLRVRGGPISITGLYAYGMKYALKQELGAGIADSNSRWEDSQFGIYAEQSNNARYDQTRLYHNFDHGAYHKDCFDVEYVNPLLFVPRSNDGTWNDVVGIEFDGGASHVIRGGLINMDDARSGTSGATAVRIKSLSDVEIQDLRIHEFDGGGVTGAKGVEIASAVKGGDIRYRIYGFNQSGDAALRVTNTGLKGVTVRVIGNSVRDTSFGGANGLNETDIAQYFDIPSGWSDCRFILMDEATGDEIELEEGAPSDPS